jgi:hypothetical protein
MGLSFLAPLFLMGALAVAIPVLIHLSQKTKKEAVQFPSLMFLTRVPYKEVRKQRIRHWLVFLLRSVAILLLTVAFARPLLENSALGNVGIADARETVIMLDQSFSMSYGARLDRALDAARGVVAGLRPDDRATLILFSDRAEMVEPPGRDLVALRSVIDRVRPTHRSTRYGPALQLAEQVLRESELPRREAVIITDFQRVGWDEEVSSKLPHGTQLTRVDVSDPDPGNIAVANVSLSRSHVSNREQVTVLARITNQGPESIAGLQVTLDVDGQRSAERVVDVAANDAVAVRFSPMPLPQRDVRYVIRAGEDAMPVDNAYHLMVSPGTPISVLILQHPSARPEESLYLERALQIGREPRYQVLIKRVNELVPADLDQVAAVILNDAPYPQREAGRRLRQYVDGGGGLLVVFGQRSGAGTWPPAMNDMLPGSVGEPVDRLAERGGTFSITDYDHPIFELFSTPRSGDFSQTRVFRYRRISQPTSGTVLARYDDAGIALAEVGLGQGKVLAWTSDMANSWNDFPVQPVFLPFVHQVVQYLAAYEPVRPSRTVGELLDLANDLVTNGDATTAPDVNSGEFDLVVTAPSGERWVVRGESPDRFLELEEQGYYEFRGLGGGDELLARIAVNVPAAESDLTTVDAEEFASAITESGGGSAAASLVATVSLEERERRQGFWWYLLITVLLVLVAESALANRAGRTKRKPTE